MGDWKYLVLGVCMVVSASVIASALDDISYQQSRVRSTNYANKDTRDVLTYEQNRDAAFSHT